MRHDREIGLNYSVSLIFSMFCSHDQVFKKYQKKLLHCNYLMFFIDCRNFEKKMLPRTHNELLFLILESVSMIIVLICWKNMAIMSSKSFSDFLFVQIVSYCIGKKHFKKCFIWQC